MNKYFWIAALSVILSGCVTVQPETTTPNRQGVSQSLHTLIVDAARRHNVPPHIALGKISVESRFNPRALGREGEIGLVQIKLASARGLGYTGTREQLFNPATNLEWGMRYLAAATRGNYSCAGISSYQRGRHSNPVCTNYGRTVLSRANSFR